MKRAPSIKRLRAAFPSLTPESLKSVCEAIHFGVGLIRVDKALANHGLEYIRDASGAVIAAYSNSGDTYAPTIIFDYASGNYRLTTVGDYVETYERRHARLP